MFTYYQQRAKNKKGFTLIELLVVIAIIGLLSSVVFASLNSARGKARDAKRKQDLSQAMTALQLYYDTYNTFQVAGSGWQGCSCGWFDYQDTGSYALSVSRALMNAGFTSGEIKHPDPGNHYMIYHPYGSQTSVCVYAQLESPTPEDTARFATVPVNPGYNMNYAVCSR
jgi:prepilin-type N-terminal cleavage/methylation domain-containing protein